MSENYNLQTDMTRRQLEFEMQRIQGMMQENLGTNEQATQRHEARVQRIHLIETEMVQLQHRHHQQVQQEKDLLSSGSPNSAGSTGLEAGAQTNVTSEVSFVEASYHELQGDLPDGTVLYNGPNGSKLVTIATQTAEQLFQLEAAKNTYEGEGGRRQSSNQNLASLYHGAWPLQGGGASDGSLAAIANQDTASVMSFQSNNTSSTTFSRAAQHQLGTKVEMVYSLLSMLGTHDKDDMSRTLLAMSSSQDSCIAMRQSGCLPLLIQLLHGNDKDSGLLGNTRGSKAARARAAAALHNIVHSHPDDKRGRREARVLRLLEQIRAHCDQLRGSSEDDEENNKQARNGSVSADIDHHPGPAIAALMKLSFDEEHRHAICTLGGLQAIAELLQLDHEVNSNTLEQYNITMRRYACMALTNLTFGDGTNKALLCSMTCSMHALVAQLLSPNEDLRQVAASVLRNLSWRADLASKKTLREVGSVTALMLAAMEVSKESTLKSILSALWNMSAHCSENKADICAVEGSLAFLVSSLTFKSPSKTLSIIENGGGILRNVSSHIAVREDYRKVLRSHGCLQILLKHLRSPSLTIVSNACGTLWNLSARCLEDQKALWELGAVSMLRNLVHSKHKMISMGSAAALKNLLSARPNLGHIEGDRLMPTNRPGLHVRRQRALETEIDLNLSETCENLESPTGSPTETRKNDPIKHKFILTNDGRHSLQHGDNDRMMHPRGLSFVRGGSADNSPLVEHRLHSPSRGVTRSGSQDSVGSTHSDISHDRGRVHNLIMKGSRYAQEKPENLSQSSCQGETSPRGGSERASYSGQSSGSRMMQVMHEVVQHVEYNASDTNYSQLNDSNVQKRLQNGIQEGGKFPVFKGQSQGYKSKDSNVYSNKSNGNVDLQNSVQHNNDRVSFRSRNERMETLHLDLPEQDEPINYSMKYPSEEQRPNNKFKTQKSSAFARPIPKVQNFVGTGNEQKFPKPSVNSVPAHSKETEDSKKDVEVDNDESAEYSGYAETDLDQDTMDQPTNFSIRYMEQDEEVHTTKEQPINYSTRFHEQETFTTHGEHKEQSQNAAPEAAILDEDTIRTFCTEGTPLTYLSTATSMNDLTGNAEKKDQTSRPPPPAKDEKTSHKSQVASNQQTSNKYPDSEKMSSTGTQSTDRYSGSTATVKNQRTESNNTSDQETSPPRPAVDSHPPSMYSYNDSTSTSSPSDKPRAYCTEGTPMSFSRRSSLSSLHSTDVYMETNNKSADQTLDDLNESDKMSSADVTLKPELQDDSFQSADTSANGPGKSVTFDENNQVHETPLMFSRCSSLGSLSSFDAHSVHSSVVSEYSRRASEVVSPSELPDSPSDTMPPSPSHRKSPDRFDENQATAERKGDKQEKQKEDKLVKLDTIPEGAELTRSQEVHKPVAVYRDNTHTYADEDDNFSCATSLSALTFDDEPDISKDPGLRKVPLGQETDPEPCQQGFSVKEQVRQDEPEKEVMSFDEDEDSVSEGEENLLAEFISQAMPTNSKKKIKKSSSDGFIKPAVVPPEQKPNTPSRIPTSASAGSLGNRMSRLPMPSRPVARLQGIVSKPEDSTDGHDSPRKFATEGTPLNYSRAESLSDLSMDSADGTGIDKTMDTVIDVQSRRKQTKVEEVHSDVSSISDDDEDLLSEAIESAMPKSGKKKGAKPTEIDRTAEGCDAKDRPKFHGTGMKPNFHQHGKKGASHQQHHGAVGDSVMSFAVEDTPISLSHATSFSDLTVDDMPDADGASEGGLAELRAAEKQASRFSKIPTNPQEKENSLDSTRMFGIEDTPMAFSRNDSLSSLSCDEEIFEELVGHKMSLAEEVEDIEKEKNKKLKKVKSMSPRKPNLEEVALSRLKTPGKIPYGPSSTSTPLTKKNASPLPIPSQQHIEEQPQTFMTEGTPMCFSRNSSLSSLGTVDHNDDGNYRQHQQQPHQHQSQHQQQQQQHKQPQQYHQYHVDDQSKDSSANYKVEDTPANFSGNSSLSALSVESLSFEATPSESALLEECINAALPKSKKKKASPSHHTSPNGNTETSETRKSARTELFAGPPSKNDVKVDSQQSKNGQGPQAEKRDTEANITAEKKTEHSLDEEAQNNRKDDILYLEGEEENGSDVDPEYEDEKLIETIQEVESKVADFDFKNGEPSERERCLEAREIPKHLLHKMVAPHQMKQNALGKSLEFSTGVIDMDLMKESFPDMSSSLVSNITTPDQDEFPLYGASSRDAESADTTISSTIADNTVITVINANDTLVEDNEENNAALVADEDDSDEGFGLDVYLGDEIHEISVEEEKALEENAKIVLSELCSKRELSTSTIDDDMFIDNETLSLVSNDYTSDTASEASVSLSSSSKAASEPNSEASSSATLSEHSNATRVIKKPKIVVAPTPGIGPRIVKPITKDTLAQQQKQQESPKGIRGGKKMASAAIRGVATGPGMRGNNVAKITPPKGVRGGAQPPKTPAGRGVGASQMKKTLSANNTPTRSPAGRGIPRPGSAKPSPPPRSSSTPPKAAQVSNSPKSSPKPPRRSSSTGRQITPPKVSASRPGSSPASGIPKPGQKNSPRGQAVGKNLKDKSAEKNQSNERPAPPIKQGTFTKDSPTDTAPENVPEISQNNTDHNGNKPGEKRQSLADRKSLSGSKLNKPEEVSKWIKDESENVRTGLKYNGVLPNQRISPTKAVLNKGANGSQSSSKTSLNKTSSGSSLNKTNSSSSLNKSMNNNNRTPLKRAESAKSDSPSRRGSAGAAQPRSATPSGRSSTSSSRAVTPTGRSQSASSRLNMSARQNSNPTPTPTSASVEADVGKPVKKQAVSKIAGLWKKDNKKVQDSNSQDVKEKRSDSVSSEGKPSKTSIKKLVKLGKSKKDKSKGLTVDVNADDSCGGGMKRSSTYDKLTPETPEVANQAHEATSSADNMSTPSLQSLEVPDDDGQKTLWRRTYTLGSEDDPSSDAVSLSAQSGEEEAPAKTTSKPKKEKKHSLSLFKRSNSRQDDDKDESSDSMKMPPPKKKGFSLWRRESSSKSDNKISALESELAKQKRPEPPRRLEGSSLPVAAIKSTPNHSPSMSDGECKSGMISVGSPLSPSKVLNAAIVAPFNYNPNQRSFNSNVEEYISQGDDEPCTPSKHMTKTEMLIARRQSYLNSMNKEKSNEQNEEKDGKRSACLVTTV